jgi:chlorobactene glucosyltransferase
MELIELYLLLIVVSSLYFAVLAVSNVIYIQVTTKKPEIVSSPKVSVLVPARNEEDNIDTCLQSLVEQTYQNYEIIVLDDNSSDNTLELLQAWQQRYPELITVIQGKPLPEDWYGKPHAMQQLADHASGEYLVFTDADTVHRNTSISWAVTNMEKHSADMISGYAHHTTHSLGENLIVPSLYLNTTLLLPLWLVQTTREPLFAFAIGQFAVFRTSTFREMNGYESVKQKITEDIYIAREMKKRGYKVLFLDEKRQCRCRMYNGLRQAVNGFEKNVYDFFEHKLYPLAILIPFAFGFFLLPIAVLIQQLVGGGDYIVHAASSVGIFFATWTIVIIDRGGKWFMPFLYPFMFLVMMVVAVKSIVDSVIGRGYEWKGRIVR